MALNRSQDELIILNDEEKQYLEYRERIEAHNKKLEEERDQLSKTTRELLDAVKPYLQDSTAATMNSLQRSQSDEDIIPSVKKVIAPKPTPVVEEPKVIDWEQIQDYCGIKHYIISLLENDLDEERKQFLTELRHSVERELRNRANRIEHVKSCEDFKSAIGMYHKLNKTEERYNKLKQEIDSNSLLLNQFAKHRLPHLTQLRNNLKNKFSEFKKEVLVNHFFSLGAHILQKVDKAFKAVELERNRIKFNYPEAYHFITHVKTPKVQQPEQSQAIRQVMSLFEDYHKKNSVLYFHWRHHSKEAKHIYTELNTILNSDTKKVDQINKAIRIILEKENELADLRKLGTHNKRESSFFRRAHYAIELLDAERARLTNTQSAVVRVGVRG